MIIYKSKRTLRAICSLTQYYLGRIDVTLVYDLVVIGVIHYVNARIMAANSLLIMKSNFYK